MTLEGEGGADTFNYGNGGGKDVIVDFDTGDLLQISETFTGTYQ